MRTLSAHRTDRVVIAGRALQTNKQTRRVVTLLAKLEKRGAFEEGIRIALCVDVIHQFLLALVYSAQVYKQIMNKITNNL
ncbi:hypothetical protein KBD61_05590 [Patescibacteria group bacterium]|nr:hypothetical protein [Patescibacteria group bacterium]